MPRVYLAGPMRGLPKYNFPAFDEARDKLRALGYTVISPADLDRDADFHETDEYTPDFLYAAMRRDIEAILKVDQIVLLPGWENSAGCKIELTVAGALGLPVVPLAVALGG